jgi:hypothetical protein
VGPYRSTSSPYPAPYARVEVWDQQTRTRVVTLDGILDTGADRTCIPRNDIESQRRYGYIDVEDFNGSISSVPYILVARAQVELLDASGSRFKTTFVPNLKLLVTDEALIGRDIANSWTASLAGPSHRWNVT